MRTGTGLTEAIVAALLISTLAIAGLQLMSGSSINLQRTEESMWHEQTAANVLARTLRIGGRELDKLGASARPASSFAPLAKDSVAQPILEEAAKAGIVVTLEVLALTDHLRGVIVRARSGSAAGVATDDPDVIAR